MLSCLRCWGVASMGGSQVLGTREGHLPPGVRRKEGIPATCNLCTDGQRRDPEVCLSLRALTTARKRADTGRLCQLQGWASSLDYRELHSDSHQKERRFYLEKWFWKFNTLSGLPGAGVLRGWHEERGISSTQKLLLGLIGLMSNLKEG